MYMNYFKQTDINEVASTFTMVKWQKGSEPLLLESNKDA